MPSTSLSPSNGPSTMLRGSTKGSYKKPSRLHPLPSTLSSSPPLSFTDPSPTLENPAADMGAGLSLTTAPPPENKETLCLDLLMKGFINSFTDFFYLTHRHDAPNSSSPSTSEPTTAPSPSTAASPSPDDTSISEPPPLVRPSSVAIPSSSLPVISSHLSLAESSHRHASPLPIFSSYTHLSTLFSSLHDYKTAVYFQEKILELAETLSSHSHTALTALATLGSLYELLDQPRVAITYFERCAQWAKEVQAMGGSGNTTDMELIQKARQQIVPRI